MAILPELIAAIATFLAAALAGWFYKSWLDPRRPKLKDAKPSSRLNNLPSASTYFVGRQDELSKLLELLSPNNSAHIICVDGIGGVGKTALVLEAAFQCLETNSFDAIVWVSAKQSILTPEGDLTRYSTPSTLTQIILAIAYTLDRRDILDAAPEERPAIVRAVVTGVRTLLIVDNLETAGDRDEVITFLYELSPQVKVVITSRERLPFLSIHLEPLSEQDGMALISHEAQVGNMTLKDEQARALYRTTGGIPLAIMFAVGQIALGYSLESVLERVKRASSDLLLFTLDSTVARVRGQPAHLLLMALAILSEGAPKETIAYVAGLGSELRSVEDGLVQLQQLNLVSRQEDMYVIHPLTRQYALGELSALPDFESEARERMNA